MLSKQMFAELSIGDSGLQKRFLSNEAFLFTRPNSNYTIVIYSDSSSWTRPSIFIFFKAVWGKVKVLPESFVS